MATTNSEIAQQITPSQPEATNVYDAHHGKYHDTVCNTPAVPAYMPLPATPSPFSNLK
jgi:hypothetical protein